MLAALTTNVTRFFREPHHFDHLKDNVLPPLLDAARRGGKVRIWSAACSSGQEPFSIAMTILALMPEAPDRDIKVLATDIDPNMVREGRGPRAALLGTGVPAPPQGSPAPARRADGRRGARHHLQQLNLIGDWPMKGVRRHLLPQRGDLLEDDTQAKLWVASRTDRIKRRPHRHSERIQGPAAPRSSRTASPPTGGSTPIRVWSSTTA
jgi:chemotaxis protein methyltransferase CheR